MSDNIKSEYFDDFEIISEANGGSLLCETAFPGQNETGNLEQSSSTEVEMAARERPVPQPRIRNKEDIHSQREGRWYEEKEKLLGKVDDLEENLVKKDEELVEQKRQYEETIKTMENEKEQLQSKHDELQSKYENELADKEKAYDEIVKDLQQKSEYKAEESNEYTNELEDLQKSLDEQTGSYNAALEKITVFEQNEIENAKEIRLLEEELTTVKEHKDLGNQKIEKLEAKVAELQDQLAKEKETLAKQKELYKELSGINDDLEKEQNESKTSMRETMEAIRKKETENEQLLQEKSEVLRQHQKAVEEHKQQVDMLVNNAQEIQRQKDNLESELVSMKLEQKRLNTENTSQDSEIQEMRSTISSLSEERDFLIEKCKKMEEGLKAKADTEVSQLSKALEALNDENEILRKRNEKLDADVVLLKNIRKELESEVSETSGKSHGNSNPAMLHGKASGKRKPTEEPGRQKQFIPEPMDTTTGAAGKQWYDTAEGGQLFGQIYQKLEDEFNGATIDIFRAKTNLNLSLTIKTNRQQRIEVHFPINFPHNKIAVSYRGSWKHTSVPYNRNAPSELPEQVAKLLHQVVKG